MKICQDRQLGKFLKSLQCYTYTKLKFQNFSKLIIIIFKLFNFIRPFSQEPAVQLKIQGSSLLGGRIRHSPRVVNLTLHNGDTSFPYSTAANCVNYIGAFKSLLFHKSQSKKNGKKKKRMRGIREYRKQKDFQLSFAT